VSPALAFPASYKELKAGKKYAWQVSLYKNQTVLNRSEIWEFTVDCKDSVVKEEYTGNYWEVDDLTGGNFHIVKGKLNIIVGNSYEPQDMNYKIKCVTDPSIKIKRLPTIILKHGNNQITIDLSNNNGFRNDYYYLLTINTPGRGVKSLRFKYIE
jgi:hypothetical protein